MELLKLGAIPPSTKELSGFRQARDEIKICLEKGFKKFI